MRVKHNKYIQSFNNFNEKLNNDIIIKQEEKTEETYNFIKQYLDVMEFDWL